MTTPTKPALPEPVALYKKLRDIGSALRDAIPALPIETANAVMDQLNRLDDAANEISTAIDAAVAEVNALNGALTDKCNSYIIANARLAEQVAEARAAPDVLKRAARSLMWLRFVWNDHNYEPMHKEVARIVDKLMPELRTLEDANDWIESDFAAPSPAEQPKPAVRDDTVRLDMLESDKMMRVFKIGKAWYWKPAYGMPHRKAKTLREAIDAALSGEQP